MIKSYGNNSKLNDVNICVFCGANVGTDPIYKKAAEELALILSRHRIGIVYGGGNIGLMGVLADAALRAGCSVIGVIPESMVEKELAHTGITRLHIVKTMSERKSLMIELSNAFIALPGGIGTFDELFEVITLKQLGFHSKPCGVLNANGYFQPFLALMTNAFEKGFIAGGLNQLFFCAETAEELVSMLIHSKTFDSSVISKR